MASLTVKLGVRPPIWIEGHDNGFNLAHLTLCDPTSTILY